MERSLPHWNAKLERNLKLLRYRFEDIYEGKLRKLDDKVIYGYAKLAEIFGIDKAAVIRICQRRLFWLKELKKLSKEYLNVKN